MALLKEVILDCGKKVTTRQIVIATGVKHSTAQKRLRTSKDFNVVFAPKGARVCQLYNTPKNTDSQLPKRQEEDRINKIIKTRPFYCPMFRLALKSI